MAGRGRAAGMRNRRLRGEPPTSRTTRQVDVLAAFVAAGGSVPDAAARVGIRPSTAKRHLADLRARSVSPRSNSSIADAPRGGLSCRALSPPDSRDLLPPRRRALDRPTRRQVHGVWELASGQERRVEPAVRGCRKSEIAMHVAWVLDVHGAVATVRVADGLDEVGVTRDDDRFLIEAVLGRRHRDHPQVRRHRPVLWGGTRRAIHARTGLYE